MRVLEPGKTRRAYPDADKQDEDRRSEQPEERAEAARECTKTYMTHGTVTAARSQGGNARFRAEKDKAREENPKEFTIV